MQQEKKVVKEKQRSWHVWGRIWGGGPDERLLAALITLTEMARMAKPLKREPANLLAICIPY